MGAKKQCMQDPQYSPFQKWLVTFCEEKEIDMSLEVTAGDGTELQVGDVMSACMSCSPSEQAQIKQTFVAIDFKNGDVYHFIRHLAQALNSSHKVQF